MKMSVATLSAFLQTRSERAVLLLATAIVLAVGALDYLTGTEISFAVFYLIPVAIAAWCASRRGGIMIAIASAAAWLIVVDLTGPRSLHLWIPVWNALTRLGFFLVVTLLLSRLRQSLARERELARTDFLTGAANPRAFYEQAAREIDRLRRYGHPFSLAYIDADDFKRINDERGHHAGSQALVRIVATLRRHTRATDVIARIGGDEFALLLPETDAEQAGLALHQLRDALQAEMHASGWELTFSIGLLTCIDPPADVDEMIRLADRLMYVVKQAGGDAIRPDVLRAIRREQAS